MGSEPLLVDAGDDRCPHRSGERGAADGPEGAVEDDDEAITDGGDIGVAPSVPVEIARGDVADVTGEVGIAVEAEVDTGEVGVDGVDLVVGRGEVIGEATARRERSSGYLVQLASRCTRRVVIVKFGRAHREDVGASCVSLRIEDGAAVAALKARCTAVWAPTDAVVATGDDNGGSLETELHDLVALALGVVRGQTDLRAAVRDGDNVCGLVDTAHALAAVAVAVRVRRVVAIRRGAVACLSKGTIGAVATVDCIVERCWPLLSSRAKVARRRKVIATHCSKSPHTCQAQPSRSIHHPSGREWSTADR